MSNETRRRALPLSVKRVEKLAQIITPYLHLKIEVSLGSSKEGYIRPGVSLKQDTAGSRGWTVEVDSKDYLILQMTEELPKSFVREEKRWPIRLTVCLTQPLLPKVVRAIKLALSECSDKELFWKEANEDGDKVWVSSGDIKPIKIDGTKGNRKFSICPQLIEVSPGSNSYVPGICLKATDSVQGKSVTVRLFKDQALELSDYLSRLDLNVMGLQLVQLAMLASAKVDAEIDTEFSKKLDKKVDKLVEMRTRKEIMEMSESDLEALMSVNGMELNFIPDDLNHFREGVVAHMKSLGKLLKGSPKK
jgi:hypothetical protein